MTILYRIPKSKLRQNNTVSCANPLTLTEMYLNRFTNPITNAPYKVGDTLGGGVIGPDCTLSIQPEGRAEVRPNTAAGPFEVFVSNADGFLTWNYKAGDGSEVVLSIQVQS